MNKFFDQIWVFNDYNVEREYIFQLLGQAKKIGNACNRSVVLVEYGNKQEDHDIYKTKGTDYILKLSIGNPTQSRCASVLKEAVQMYEPFLVMVTTSEISRMIVAKICTELKLGFVADCMRMKYTEEDDRIIFTRTAIESTTEADILISSNTQVCTVKNNTFLQIEHFATNDIYEEKLYFEACNDITETFFNLINEEKNEVTEEENIEDADIVFGVGRGAVDSLDEIRTIARYCKATIGCTRAMVDNGYFDKRHQIGQSGKSIKARLYVAFGISGASQHIVGILNAKNIIAINEEEQAPIIQYSDYAYIVDIKEVCKKLLDIISQ